MTEVSFKNKSIITLDDLTRGEIMHLVKKANDMIAEERNGNRHMHVLQNKTLGPFFAQESTRTKGSFIMAMKELGGTNYSFHAAGSSLSKNESVFYTVQMFHAHHVDAIAMRHYFDGSVQFAADVSKLPVINAGDGKNWHPTQSLLDILTIYQLRDSKLDNLKLGLSGDLKYGRTVHSLPLGLSKFDNLEIHIGAPELLMMPNYMIENLKNNGVKVVLHDNILDLLKNVDIHYHTRPQFNIMKDDPNAPSESEIKTAFHDWRITIGVVNKVGESNLPYIMHPLPIDSKVSEIDIEVTFLPKQKYLYQAECGLFMRKALLKEILGGTNYIKFNGDMSFMSDLYDSNHIQRIIKNGEGPRETNPGDISPICYGMVIDHLDPGSIDKIKSDLGLDNQRINNTSRANADSPGNKPKGIVFVNDYYLTDKEMKQIAKISPNATFNVIRGGTIVEKFVYATCSNDNCISNQIFEEVPIIFENRGNTPSCHYCRKPSDTQYDRITPKEMQTFIETLAIK